MTAEHYTITNNDMKILEWIKTAVRWVLVSSDDASRWSLTVKASLLGAIPFVMQGIGITCGLNLVCPTVSSDLLTEVALSLSNLVYLGLSVVAAIGAFYGLVRKVMNTMNGTHAGLSN